MNTTKCRPNEETPTRYLDMSEVTSTHASPSLTCSAIVQLNAGEYVDIRVYQNSGSSINLDGGPEQTYCDIEQIG